jgi:hypothetical protein
VTLTLWLLMLVAAELGIVAWNLWRLTRILTMFKQELDAGILQAQDGSGRTQS